MVKNQWPGCALAVLLSGLALPLQAATIVVSSMGDIAGNDGICSLREAITAANTNLSSGAAAGECGAGEAGADTINFGTSGTIQPQSPLPTITTPIHINGYSAPGASKNTLPLFGGTNAVLTVIIDATLAGNSPTLQVFGISAAGSTIEGLVLNNSGSEVCCTQNGILVQSVSGATTTLRGNFVGTNAPGTTGQGNNNQAIFIDGSSNVVVGTESEGNPAYDPGALNLISGNLSVGMLIRGSTSIRIRGNFIGTNASGTASLQNNAYGILFQNQGSTQIVENLVSGNLLTGIAISPSSSSIEIRRNRIGTNAAGTGALANMDRGITVHDGNTQNVDINENLVAFNSFGGISVGYFNPADTVSGIRMSANRVFSNSGGVPEIDLFTPGGILGVTANDEDDPDTGPNALQNFPVITQATANGTQVTVGFNFNSVPSRTYTAEFFHTTSCDDSGHGGAHTYLGSRQVNTNGFGDASDSVILPLTATTGAITATATHAVDGTSEFSACFVLASPLVFKDGFEGP